MQYQKIGIPAGLQQLGIDEAELESVEAHRQVTVKSRKTLKAFMDSFKNGLIEMFKEEGDSEL